MTLWQDIGTRLGRWLIRKLREVQHNMSHCGVLSWKGVQAKSWTCTLSVVPCPETWSLNNVALLASHFILGPLSKVVCSTIFHDVGSVHAAAVSAHAEWRILHWASRCTEQLHKHLKSSTLLVCLSVFSWAAWPSINPLSVSRAMRTCRSTWPSRCFLFLLGKKEKNLQRNTLWAHLMKWGLNVSLKYLTPSAVFRCSRSRSPLYISASPTRLFFSAGPWFSASSTARSNPAVDQLLELKTRTSKEVESLLYSTSCWNLICRLCAMCSKPMIRPVFLCFQLASHQDLPHSHSPLTLLQSSINTHSRGILCTTIPSPGK